MSLLGGVLGSVVGGLFGSSQSNRAARAQEQAANAAIAEQRRQFDLTREDTAPIRQVGLNALAQLQDPARNFMASPGFEFVRNEGMRGIERSAAARGGGASGNALRALAQFNSGLAQQDFGNWWNRTAGLAGMGQAAQQQTNFLGANMANNNANAMINAGEARASGITAGANALSQGLSGAVDAWNYFRRPQVTTGGGWASGGAGRPPWMTPPIWQGPGSGQRFG